MEKEIRAVEEEEEVLRLQIKFGGDTICVSISPDSTVSELKTQLQSSTNVLPRGQKLIHKGKVLVDSNTLRASNIINGSKMMLMASHGLHQGVGPKLKDAPVTSNFARVMKSDCKPTKAPAAVVKSQNERWKVTGVVALSQSHLQVIPEQVWECGSSARVVDLSHNHITNVPINIASLTHLQKLILNTNQISDDSINWQALLHLNSLSHLSLNQNNLTYLPPSLGSLTTLQQLEVASNKLESIPVELGCLTRLEILKVNYNRIKAIPTSVGNCSSLIEVDLSSNLLVELPETFDSLQKLKILRLSNNGLKLLPSSIFRNCCRLTTLDLHGTEITMDILRQAEGWDEFDERRRLKYQKQLDFRAGGSTDFDEGADKN